MKHKYTLFILATLFAFAACQKEDDDDHGNLLGAWQVYSSIAYEYDSYGNLQNTWDGGLAWTYMDTNDEGRYEPYQFNVATGDNWVFVNDTVVHIKDKNFTYRNIIIDGEPYIRLDSHIDNIQQYKIQTLSKSQLALENITVVENGHYFKSIIQFNKL
ncbi:MAG: hypothetical protein J6X88_11105 [Bacteroidales bacterium]|nr:hypothetical protein [Bacteroidales bacterium]